MEIDGPMDRDNDLFRESSSGGAFEVGPSTHPSAPS